MKKLETSNKNHYTCKSEPPKLFLSFINFYVLEWPKILLQFFLSFLKVDFSLFENALQILVLLDLCFLVAILSLFWSRRRGGRLSLAPTHLQQSRWCRCWSRRCRKSKPTTTTPPPATTHTTAPSDQQIQVELPTHIHNAFLSNQENIDPLTLHTLTNLGPSTACTVSRPRQTRLATPTNGFITGEQQNGNSPHALSNLRFITVDWHKIC